MLNVLGRVGRGLICYAPVNLVSYDVTVNWK